MKDPQLTMRIRMATLGHTGREVALTVGMNQESVRRYLRGAKPSVAFIKQVCLKYGVTADWLVLGEGPRTHEELKDELITNLDSGRFAEMMSERFTMLENRLAAIEHLLTADRTQQPEQGGASRRGSHLNHNSTTSTAGRDRSGVAG